MSEFVLKNDWREVLSEALEAPSFLALQAFLTQAYRREKIHPDKSDLFTALHLTSYAEVKVLVLGQDPYHGDGQAHGLSFSVLRPTPPPPSLVNIFKELKADLGIEAPGHGELTSWARQGVLMINAVLTVRHKSPQSHKNKGWEPFTDAIIDAVNRKSEAVVFVLWGRQAQAKASRITNPLHLVLKAPHPSPLSAYGGFFESKPFSKINAFLEKSGRGAIDWRID